MEDHLTKAEKLLDLPSSVIGSCGLQVHQQHDKPFHSWAIADMDYGTEWIVVGQLVCRMYAKSC